MSIPLDQLYHYIEQLAEHAHGDHVVIYRFYPHGSKEIKNLSFLRDHETLAEILLRPEIFCNDQEPLDFDRYEQETFLNPDTLNMVQQMGYRKQNLRDYPKNIWRHAVLLHSEQRSRDLQQYLDQDFVPVYYWSHAVMARDWFRAAEYLDAKKHQTTQPFLIYNRAWSGTREYRLKFSDLLVDLDLVDCCRTWVNGLDTCLDLHYSRYDFVNTVWKPSNQLENYFKPTAANSEHSAMFDLEDYAATDIEVVLETLFDDDRLHLTEKSLRPIALAQPFVLVSTHGSLEYLCSYGFQTYDSIWSEHYDQVQDPVQRMNEILKVMHEISAWDQPTRCVKMQQAQEIADYNRQHFFSRNFLQLILGELQTNLDRAFETLKNSHSDTCPLDPRKYKHEFVETLLNHPVSQSCSPTDWGKIINDILVMAFQRQKSKSNS
jgi:hypothetical protein